MSMPVHFQFAGFATPPGAEKLVSGMWLMDQVPSTGELVTYADDGAEVRQFRVLQVTWVLYARGLKGAYVVLEG